MKKRIIQTILALMGLVASFMPQKAEACKAVCEFGSCSTDVHNGLCFCTYHGWPVCFDSP